MKTKERTLVILLVVLAVLLGLWAVLKNTAGEEDASSSGAAGDGTVLLGGTSDEVQRIEWTADGHTLALEQVEDETADASSASSSSESAGSTLWIWPDDTTLPVNQTKAAGLASTLTGLTASRYLGADRDPADYGLDSPRFSVTLTAGEEAATLLVGDVNDTTGDVYVMLEGDSGIYTVSDDFTADFPTDPLELVQLETLTAAALDEVTGLTFDGPSGSVQLTYMEDGVPGTGGMRHWQVEQNGQTYSADDDAVTELLRNLVSVQFTACAAWNTEDLASFGLETPVCTMTVQYTQTTDTGETDEDGNTITTETPVQYTLLFGNTADDGLYAMQQGGGQVGLVSADLLDGIANLSPSSLLPATMCNVPMSELDSFTVTSEGTSETFRVTRVVNTDEDGVTSNDETWSRTGGELDESALFTFYGNLCGVELEQPGAVEPTGETSFRVDFHFTNGDTVSLELAVYDSSFYSATFMGQSIGLVNRRDVESLQTEFTGLLG